MLCMPMGVVTMAEAGKQLVAFVVLPTTAHADTHAQRGT